MSLATPNGPPPLEELTTSHVDYHVVVPMSIVKSLSMHLKKC